MPGDPSAPDSADGSIPEKSDGQFVSDELRRRARSSARSLVAWCEQAGLEPEWVLEDVRRTMDALRADGGVLSYECPDCGDVPKCDVDDAGQRRCPDCGRAVTTLTSDGGEMIETEWTLTCLDCEFSMEIKAAGHPHEGPPDVVRDRVTTHKHTTDESHVVRVAGRRADRDDRGGDVDPSLVTDGGRVMCGQCNRWYDRSDHDGCPHCVHADLDEFATDGGLNKCASMGCNNPVATRNERCDECRRNDLRTDGGSEFDERVDEMVEEIEDEIDDSTMAEAMLYARCSAAFEDAVNNSDLPTENALGVMTAALFEATDQSGYERSDVLETAREHYADEEVQQ